MSLHSEHSHESHVPSADETSLPELEADQSVPPRPEEEIADELRAKPDLEDHSEHRVTPPPTTK